MDTNLYETVVGGQADSDVIYKAIPFTWDEGLQAVHYLFEKEGGKKSYFKITKTSFVSSSSGAIRQNYWNSFTQKVA